MRRGAIALAVLAAAACGEKKQGAPKAEPAPVAVAPTPAPVVVDGPIPVAPDAPVPSPVEDTPPMPSETLIAEGLGPILLAGPAQGPPGTVVWCTRGDNGMAEWRETTCHVVAAGKKPVVTPVMTYADAMTVDEGVDPAGDPDAGPRAASARERVQAALDKLVLGGRGLVALPAPVRCDFDAGELTGRSDVGEPADPRAAPEAADVCQVGGLTASVNPQGKVTIVRADTQLFAEVFKPRARGKGDAGAECSLEARHVELAVDAAAKLAAVAVWMSNPSDACALVTEFEVRAFAL